MATLDEIFLAIGATHWHAGAYKYLRPHLFLFEHTFILHLYRLVHLCEMYKFPCLQDPNCDICGSHDATENTEGSFRPLGVSQKKEKFG